MAEQFAAERALDSGEMQKSPLKACDSTSTLSLLDAGPASLSPEVTACTVGGDITSLVQLETISAEESAHSLDQVVKKSNQSIFDDESTSRPRRSKRQKQFTYDNYDSEYPKQSFHQHYSKGLQDALLSVKYNDTLDTKSNELKTFHNTDRSNVDQPELQLENMYSELSQKVIDEVLKNVQFSTKGQICMNDNKFTVRTVASMIETFVTLSRSSLGILENDAAATTLSAVKGVRVSRLVQLEGKRKNVAKTLSFDNQAYYLDVIPADVVGRLEEKGGICIANTTRKGPVGKLRCTGRYMNSEAALKPPQELANLPQPRDFSTITTILEDVIQYAVCERYHREKARAGLEQLRDHFLRSVDEEEKMERKEQGTQLAQWITRIIEPFVSRAKVQKNEAVSDDISKKGDHTNEISFKVPTQTTKQDLKVSPNTPALLVIKESVIGLKTTTCQVKSVLHIGQLTPHVWSIAHRALSPERLVKTIAKSKLTNGDIDRRGRIYVFWQLGSFGWVKIGYTTVETEERIDRWKAQCRLDASELYPRKEDEEWISHPLRVEKLIHAELKEKRYAITRCQGCGRSHNEWFEINVKDALAIVKKWTDWMRDSNPYDKEGNFKTDVEVTLPLLMGESGSKVILKPARGGRLSSRVTRQTTRRSLRTSEQQAN